MVTSRNRPALILGVVAVFAVAARPGAAQSVSEWGEVLASPVLAGAGVEGAGRVFAWGHLEIALESGRVYPVAAGTRTIGVFLAGAGRMRYRSADAIEADTWRSNVARASDYTADADGGILERFETALVIVSSGGEALAPEGDRGAAPAAVARQFSRHLEARRHDRGWGFEQLLIQAFLDPPADALVVAEVDGEHHDLRWMYDPVRDHDESLEILRESGTRVAPWKDWRYPDLLSVQPIRRAPLEPRPVRWKLRDVDTTIVNRDDRDAEVLVVERIEAVAGTAPLRSIELRLANSISGQVGLRGPTELHYRLDRVRDGEGRALAFVQRQQDLVVELAEPLVAGACVELQFDLRGDVLFQPRGDNYWEMAWAWYPQPWRRAMESFSYHAVVKAPKPWTAFSNGHTMRRWEEGDLACAEFHEPGPMQAAVVLAGRYETESETRGGLTVRVSSYAMRNQRAARRLTDLIFTLVAAYQPVLGDYPFSELNVLEINSYGFGSAPAGILFLTKDVFTPMHDALTRLFWNRIDARVAHELAHGWWGHVAKLSDVEDQWLSESLADYAAAVILSRERMRDFKSSLEMWRAGASKIATKSSVYLANRVAGDEAEADRRHLLYFRGPLMLEALRRELGDDVFFAVLRGFLRARAREPAWTGDFIACASEVAGRDLKPWFERHLLGSDWPPLEKP